MLASDWIAGELGKVKLAFVPDCGKVEGVRRAVGLLALPGCLWLQKSPDVGGGAMQAGGVGGEGMAVGIGGEPVAEVRLAEAATKLPDVGESSRSGPRDYMLSGKDHGVFAKKISREVDVGAVVGDLFNAGVGSANRLLGEEFGVLTTESVTEKYVPVLGHVEEAASVVESPREWLRPVGEGVEEAPPLRNLVVTAPGMTGINLVGGDGETWDTQMDEDEDMVLGGFGDGKMSENELNASYNGEDINEDESDEEGVVPKRGASSCKDCTGAVVRIQLRLRKLTSMVSLLMADRGLAGFGKSQRCEKERRRCAQNRLEGLK